MGRQYLTVQPNSNLMCLVPSTGPTKTPASTHLKHPPPSSAAH